MADIFTHLANNILGHIMNKIRTLMETIAKINETGIRKGNDAVIASYKADDSPDFNVERELQVVGQPGSLEAWYRVMNESLGWNENEYNDFNANTVYDVLKRFQHKSFSFYPGREYSPVLYIAYAPRNNRDEGQGALEAFRDFVSDNSGELNVSEVHLYPRNDFSEGPILRLWWD